MGIMGVPECAVVGNASETPDSVTGVTGNPAAPQFANDTLPEEVPNAEAEGMVVLSTAAQRQLREEADQPGEA